MTIVKKYKVALDTSAFSLAILSVAFMLFNLVVIPLHKEQIFYERESLTVVEIFILIGFIIIIFSNILSLYWLTIQIKRTGKFATGNILVLFLGIFCLIMLLGDKVMLDEIGREMRIGWETLGEWIILYILFLIQLSYSIVILFKIKHLTIASNGRL